MSGVDVEAQPPRVRRPWHAVHQPSRRDSFDQAGTQVWRDRNQFFVDRASRDNLLLRLSISGILALALAVLAHGGLPWWRVAVIGAALVVMQGLHGTLLGRPLPAERIGRMFFLMAMVGQLFMVTFATLTGGLHSPMTPVLTMSIVLALFFYGPHGLTWRLTVSLAVFCAIMGVLPPEVTGPAIPEQHFVAATLIGLTATLVGMHASSSSRLHEASALALCSLGQAREERVADAEAQTRRLQAVGSKVAHELKNPLAAIKGLIQLVARNPAGDRTQERLAVVQSEIVRMETILSEYLSFARPLEDLRDEPIDLATLATDVAAVVAGRVDQGGLTLAMDARPTRLRADPRRMREAVINLVTNAIEATPPGGTLRLRTRPTEGGGGVLEIEDNGRGIPEADLARLGTSFFTTRVDGTGLGVVLVHGVVSQHGGTLTYDSAPGRGTIARVTLPAQPPAPTASLATPPEPAPACLPEATAAAPAYCAIGNVFRRRVVERDA
ncbi:MAG: HAMP domain-containing sensor histidine kinase [Kofleriaceae bacterium]